MGNLLATNKAEKRDLIPAKTYLAIVCGVYDLGTQTSQFGDQHQIYISWELHRAKGPVRDKEGRVQTIGKFVTLSFNEKANLRKDIVQPMLGRTFTEDEAKSGYDVEQLVGLACRLQVDHVVKPDKSIRDQVGSIMALDEDDDAPRPELNHVYFEISGIGCDIPREVPEWIGKMVKKSPEWTGKSNTPAAKQPIDGDDDDVKPTDNSVDEDKVPF